MPFIGKSMSLFSRGGRQVLKRSDNVLVEDNTGSAPFGGKNIKCLIFMRQNMF